MNKLKQEQETRAKFSGMKYDPRSICLSVPKNPQTYFERLLHEKLLMVKQALPKKSARILDLCCGNGEHLAEFAPNVKMTIGIDFSLPAISAAIEQAEIGFKRSYFVGANARFLPLKSGCMDVVYCFSSLYYMPFLGQVVQEIARILTLGGRCVLDLGNLWSLNTVVAQAYPELASSSHVSVPQMRRKIRKAGLAILCHRAAQILPFWGDRPRWLKFFLHPIWVKIMGVCVGKFMLDQWISSIPPLKFLAFRHLFLCEKVRE